MCSHESLNAVNKLTLRKSPSFKKKNNWALNPLLTTLWRFGPYGLQLSQCCFLHSQDSNMRHHSRKTGAKTLESALVIKPSYNNYHDTQYPSGKVEFDFFSRYAPTFARIVLVEFPPKLINSLK